MEAKKNAPSFAFSSPRIPPPFRPLSASNSNERGRERSRSCVDAWEMTESTSGRWVFSRKRTRASERRESLACCCSLGAATFDLFFAADAKKNSPSPLLSHLVGLGASAVRPDVEVTPVPRMEPTGAIAQAEGGGARVGGRGRLRVEKSLGEGAEKK